jgi:hypothetical protein
LGVCHGLILTAGWPLISLNILFDSERGF